MSYHPKYDELSDKLIHIYANLLLQSCKKNRPKTEKKNKTANHFQNQII